MLLRNLRAESRQTWKPGTFSQYASPKAHSLNCTHIAVSHKPRRPSSRHEPHDASVGSVSSSPSSSSLSSVSWWELWLARMSTRTRARPCHCMWFLLTSTIYLLYLPSSPSSPVRFAAIYPPLRSLLFICMGLLPTCLFCLITYLFVLHTTVLS